MGIVVRILQIYSNAFIVLLRKLHANEFVYVFEKIEQKKIKKKQILNYYSHKEILF